MKKDIIIIGAGIAGQALALAEAKKGNKVTVFDRTSQPVGASVRNFGMVWPIGQPEGVFYEVALRSRQIWKELIAATGIYSDQIGSLHLGYRDDEWDVLQEFYQAYQDGPYELELVEAGKIDKYSNAVKKENLKGGVFSKTEVIVDPREALRTFPSYLSEQLGVTFHWNTLVKEVGDSKVTTSDGRIFVADQIYVCSGPDLETLYPEIYTSWGVTKCKLQMMRTVAQPNNWRLGPALAAGLTLTHYKAFDKCPSLGKLKSRIEEEMPLYPKYGIHVMASQTGLGELTLGDSHEYGLTHDPFDRMEINQLVLDYLKTFLDAPTFALQESWHGIYPKSTTGKTVLIAQPEENIILMNALGGAGMTLSFGVADRIANGNWDDLI
ncbi:TIGR03364 family FAD-dependent oxidoreductase [Limibacter armeniacum]|uniref:TIGR03364 family FAD-dependent oxidoreductase n=1 Tax=Limibacter armeniacum TaxID=466084 RepID=UPI002FE6B05C